MCSYQYSFIYLLYHNNDINFSKNEKLINSKQKIKKYINKISPEFLIMLKIIIIIYISIQVIIIFEQIFILKFQQNGLSKSKIDYNLTML